MGERGSALFAPYRAVGLVAGDVGAAVNHRGKEAYATVCVGNVVQVFDCKRLTLKFVLPKFMHKVRALAVTKLGLVFIAVKSDIFLYHRASLLATLRNHTSRIVSLYLVESLLFSLDKSSSLSIWDLSSSPSSPSLLYSLPLSSTSPPFTPSCFIHPSTYLNKILVASQEGPLRLLNVRRKAIVYEFGGWGCGVVCMEQSPALDVVGCGLSDGRIIVHNIKTDVTLMVFQLFQGACTRLAFRSDGPPLLLSGSSLGEIAIWNLKIQTLEGVMPLCHPSSPIVTLHCFPGQPLLLTSSTDNSLKMWIFDQSDNTGRLLRERGGHSAPPTRVRFYGLDDSHHILSCGSDRSVRVFNTIQDHQSVALSQGHVRSKAKRLHKSEESLLLPPAIAISSHPAREREWDNILTCHAGSKAAHTWSFQRKAIGKHTLRKKGDGPSVTWSCCYVSPCGNFGVLGSLEGTIEVFNLQSGIYRGGFVDAAIGGSAHRKAVTGVIVDEVGKYLVSASVDQSLKIWHFKKRTLERTCILECGISSITSSRDGSFFAAVCNDFSVRVFDIVLGRLVRHFAGHTNKITDIAFSEDGRWIVTSAMDRTLCVWDLPSSTLIDFFRVEEAVTSLAFSPTGNYLVTTHQDDVGVYLWCNKSFFGKVFVKPLSGSVFEEEGVVVSLPSINAEEGEGGEDGDVEEEEERLLKRDSLESLGEEEERRKKAPGVDNEGLVTLSGLPSNHWKNLPNLDIIRERNKAKEPPKKPQAAPFFLSLTASSSDASSVTAPLKGQSRVLSDSLSGETSSHFYQLLRSAESEGDSVYLEAVTHLSSLGPSATELEFQMVGGDAEKDIATAMAFFLSVLETSAHFDLVESWMSLFLKLHADMIASSPSLRTLSMELEERQHRSWTRLEGLFQNTLCLINLLSGVGLSG